MNLKESVEGRKFVIIISKIKKKCITQKRGAWNTKYITITESWGSLVVKHHPFCMVLLAYFLELSKGKDLRLSPKQTPGEIMTSAFQLNCLMCQCPGPWYLSVPIYLFKPICSSPCSILLRFLGSPGPEYTSIHTGVGSLSSKTTVTSLIPLK